MITFILVHKTISFTSLTNINPSYLVVYIKINFCESATFYDNIVLRNKLVVQHVQIIVQNLQTDDNMLLVNVTWSNDMTLVILYWLIMCCQHLLVIKIKPIYHPLSDAWDKKINSKEQQKQFVVTFLFVIKRKVARRYAHY